MTFHNTILRRLLAGVLSAAFLLGGCQLGAGASTPTPAATAIPTLPPVVIPTDAAGRIILVTPPGVDAARQQAVQPVIEELAKGAGFAVETRTDIPTGVIAGNWKVVYMLGSLPNQDELAASAPGTQFVAFDGVQMQPAANVSFLKVNTAFRAFMAGYIGALVAPDWRVGGLLPAESPELSDAFINGGQYWCGRCNQANPPFANFPNAQTQVEGSSPLKWQESVVELQKVGTEVIYMSPEATSPELLVSLAGQNFTFIGSATPPDQVRDKWIATLTQDQTGTLQKIWPDLIAGVGGKTYDVALQITDINPYYLSDGKVRLINETLDALTAGTISPFTVEE
jgi:hypothetical protein